MSTPEEQLQRASSAGEPLTAESPTAESGNGDALRGLRARLSRFNAGRRDESLTDVTQVSSDDAAPAPPRRRRFGGDSGTATVASAPSAPPVPLAPPVPYASPHAEAEAVLLTESPALDDAYPARSATASPTAYGERKVRATVTKVDLWSVTKLSLCFYISSMFVMVVALVALWLVADAAGIIHSVEKFLGDLLSAKDFKFLSGDVLRGTILVGLVIVALQVVITVIAASFYNIFAELFGGLEIVVKEEEELRR